MALVAWVELVEAVGGAAGGGQRFGGNRDRDEDEDERLQEHD